MTKQEETMRETEARLRKREEKEVEQLETFKSEWAALNTDAEIWEVDGIKGIFYPSTKTDFVNRWREINHPDTMFSVTRDKRGDGYGLYRYDDHPSIDFRRLSELEDIEFTHANGFYATTKEIECPNINSTHKILKEMLELSMFNAKDDEDDEDDEE